jgi:predicted ArsR family transcriptional regulator
MLINGIAYMIEITRGTIEELIIKRLQKVYPITVSDLEEQLHLSRNNILRVLKQLQIKGIVQLEPLPDKIYIRLLRQDFRFIGRKHQKKFKKFHSSGKKQKPKDYDGMMFS